MVRCGSESFIRLDAELVMLFGDVTRIGETVESNEPSGSEHTKLRNTGQHYDVIVTAETKHKGQTLVTNLSAPRCCELFDQSPMEGLSENLVHMARGIYRNSSHVFHLAEASYHRALPLLSPSKFRQPAADPDPSPLPVTEKSDFRPLQTKPRRVNFSDPIDILPAHTRHTQSAGSRALPNCRRRGRGGAPGGGIVDPETWLEGYAERSRELVTWPRRRVKSRWHGRPTNAHTGSKGARQGPGSGGADLRRVDLESIGAMRIAGRHSTPLRRERGRGPTRGTRMRTPPPNPVSPSAALWRIGVLSILSRTTPAPAPAPTPAPNDSSQPLN
ncbi:hypothetical protein AXG93_1335s1430 [Marchantia polymorpha subsp. ruderalis]|uniref:Uncharacterized protein n=1 Tax=Marchantia polymorpha subsp. ruderalis TaxID=1480154 RepID=A0A176W7P9_MARPO|nr:hypothetical protein AXG93_1335s1430 [Marchantia polymorpha subsp. ruderalis]